MGEEISEFDCEQEKQLKVNRLDKFCAARMRSAGGSQPSIFDSAVAAARPIVVTQCARRMRLSQQSMTLQLPIAHYM